MVPTELPEILLYGVIDSEMSLAFAVEIAWLKKQGFTEYNLRINSKGGETSDGVAMYTVQRSCGMICNVYIDGVAASMASVLAFAGAKLYMSKYARLMMHKPIGGAFGTAADLRAKADYVDGIEKDMCEVYSRRTGKPTEEVMAEFLNGKDNFYTATQAMDAKLIDGVYDGEEMEMPADSDLDADGIYMLFQDKQSKIKTEVNMDMIQLEFDAELGKMLGTGVSASSDSASIKGAIKALHARATKYDTVSAELKTLRKENVTNQVIAMLTEAKKDKKISVAEYDVLAEQYEENPDALEKLLKARGVFTSVTSQIRQADKEGVFSQEVTNMVGKGWDALMQTGEMADLKKLSPEAYAQMKEARYGVK
ncbi:head maturation protease, ClpP-related [Flavipsychrobacter stenotrophus]|nr:head maturation protease, ClpP-related [Flavipsychrobacter stenotrophus]